MPYGAAYDLFRKVFFVSNYCYDGYCTYDLKEFRSADILLELIRKFYDYKPDERDALFSILSRVVRQLQEKR